MCVLLGYSCNLKSPNLCDTICRRWLAENMHVKYLWIPYTDTIVVVQCNPLSNWRNPPKFKPKYSEDEAVQHVRDLYRDSLRKYR